MEEVRRPKHIRNRPGETWKRFDEKHLISSCGRWYSENSHSLMKQFPNSSGYYRVKIQQKQIFTHIKVVEYFGDINGSNLEDIISLFEAGLSIDHIDRNKRHNGVDNLELVTHQENCIRRSRANCSICVS